MRSDLSLAVSNASALLRGGRLPARSGKPAGKRIEALLGALLGVLLLSASPAAQADIYGFIDPDGTAHMATEKLDERYRLFLRGNASFDSNTMSDDMPGIRQTSAGTPLTQYLTQHPGLKKYDAMVKRSAQEFSIEPALLKAVMAVESGFNPAAVSPKGAVGLMQIMPQTARRYGLQADRRHSFEQKLSDPQINIRLAAHYLSDLRQLFPQRLELAIASYNAGEGAVQKYRNQIPPYPETRNYVQLVAQLYRLYQPFPTRTGAQAHRVQMILPGRRPSPAPTPSLE
ncbi:lytic transglycosylase domain-containing protein [Herbaspirillum sp. RTI4]|uniref:lytic transglycosylase domain-containing protein n=1 Tax=Herbaspirillum sp. RTI4 TaxID=3048640 RepID=UPI002AB44912|nr:lytic transglycosylase domain-containing protein [Herbaspirillum sp. RTI4]MDY7579729.1 lytic transglycosylase domain-containing protein [Herbaspirillum sp. RTI4]MEA9982703.1 lytic transglycosylase domain-containing protein [Herbaspirillum sp. RTI4]